MKTLSFAVRLIPAGRVVCGSPFYVALGGVVHMFPWFPFFFRLPARARPPDEILIGRHRHGRGHTTGPQKGDGFSLRPRRKRGCFRPRDGGGGLRFQSSPAG